MGREKSREEIVLLPSFERAGVIKAKGHRDLVTVIGSLPSVSAGEWLTAEGQWVQDREFGQQFRAEMLSSTAPNTREGIEKYLGSGMVKGIGPVYAKKLVEKFAEQIFDVIETASARLEEIDGIGPKRRKRIKEAWAEQKVIRTIMVFLHSNGVSTSRAVRIYKTYGETAVETVQANPYALAKDIHGIGFKTADQIAQKIGIPHDSLIRACAGLSHVLLEATGNGHCALPLELLLDEAGKLLLVDEKIATAALNKTLADGDLIQERINDQELIFLPSLKRAEEGIARRIKHLCALPPTYPPIDFAKAVEWCQAKTSMELAPIRELNVRLQTELNPVRPGEPSVEKFGRLFRSRDKVIQTENNNDKEVFNGDIGQIVKIDTVEREVTVSFDAREVVYDFGALDEVSLAYAITVHKSQGSEFPAIVIPLAMQQYMLLQRNLVYTGITRGKKLVVLIGQRKALAIAVRNNKTEQRFSGLLQPLQG